MWTPYQMNILLHHHVSVGPFQHWQAPAYAEEVARLTELGLLECDLDGKLTTTEKAAALIDMWRSTPLPIMRWLDPRFEEQKHG